MVDFQYVTLHCGYDYKKADMHIRNKTVVVTGAAGGIGKGLAERFSHEGAHVICADIDFADARRVAEDIDGHALSCDVSNENDIRSLIENAEDTIAPINLFCANTGILLMEVQTEPLNRPGFTGGFLVQISGCFFSGIQGLRFFRETIPNEWETLQSQVSDNFRVVTYEKFRVLQ